MARADAAEPGAGRVPPAADLLLAAVLGALHSLPFVHTAAWALQLACVGVLAWRVSRAAPWRAAALGLCFGTAWLACGTWWLFISLHRYGGLPAWMAASAVGLLAVLLSLYLAAAMAAAARWRCGRVLPDALLFAAVWLLAELARGVIFTGFPWVASGYAHVDGPLAVLAPWIGVYGLGAVAAWLAAVVALQPARRPVRALAAAGGAVALLAGLAAAGAPGFTRPSGTLSLTLLQGNVAQDEKFAAEHLPGALDWARTQLLAARGELVLAPETVIPLLPDQLDPAWWAPIAAHFHGGTQAVLLGLPLGSYDAGYTNSAAGLSADTRGLAGGYYRYDKHHLVPFGEFIPTGFRWFTELMNIPLGDFSRGPLVAPSFGFRGERIAPNICYEDLFGEELAARFVDEAQAPTVLANLSNIGWFGDSIAVAQHLQISRLRTLELQRPMLRATNTGATAAIDHRGRVTHALAPHTQGVLDARVEGRTGLTPFAWWAGRFGLTPLALLAFAVVAVRALAARRGGA